MKPLSRLLSTRDDISVELKEQLASLDASNGRVPVAFGYELFETAARLIGDPDLGLHAALYAKQTDFEVLEWVVSSAATWRDACDTNCRYGRVFNEAADYRVEVCADKAHIIFGSTVPLKRVCSDFRLALSHLGVQRWSRSTWPELAVWMKHEQPSDMSVYRAIFPDCKLIFRAAFDGFVYDASRLDTPLPTADPARHGAMRAHVDKLLEALTPGDSLVTRASRDILSTMRQGNVAAERTAARLGMARRTLGRRLQEHGTSYSELLKEVRYRTAIHYLQNTSHSVEDIAFLLGYSECAPFVRAFKRWSGRAPFEYRRFHAATPEAHPSEKLAR
jgi:AraC-like DNA-binding protein